MKENALAQALLDLDEDYPGPPESEMVIPFDVWSRLIEMANEIIDQEDRS